MRESWPCGYSATTSFCLQRDTDHHSARPPLIDHPSHYCLHTIYCEVHMIDVLGIVFYPFTIKWHPTTILADL